MKTRNTLQGNGGFQIQMQFSLSKSNVGIWGHVNPEILKFIDRCNFWNLTMTYKKLKILERKWVTESIFGI